MKEMSKNLVLNIKTFNPLNVSSKFAICGLPIRIDSYKTCSFGCKYCFAENRKIMEYDKHIQIGNVRQVKQKLHRIFDERTVDATKLLDVLIADGITWHCGGMSDPFQPCEQKYHITKQIVDIANEYNVSILFSTKSNCLYGADVKPDLHTFQLSVSNVDDRRDIEPNVPSIAERYRFFCDLKNAGFRVGIRIQPFIPNVSTLKIVEMFKDADQFTIEGVKIVPQNKECKDFILEHLGLNRCDFTQMGLLNLKPEIRLQLYKPFIDYFKQNDIPYSIADNDLRWIGNNKCCCGDRLVKKSTNFNTTRMIMDYGIEYDKKQLDEELGCSGCGDCKCNNLFTSNRQEGCITVSDFYGKRFERKSSPFSPKFQYVSETIS